MKRLALCFVTIALALILCAAGFSEALPAPSTDFYYYDAANVLDYETEAVIYFNNVELQKLTGAQIVVAAVDTTGALSCREYAGQLFNRWGIGDKDKNNGYLLLLAIGDDDYYLAMGSGADVITSEELLSELLYTYLEPDFAAKNYSAGVQKLFEQLFKTVCAYSGAELGYTGPDEIEISSLPEPDPHAGENAAAPAQAGSDLTGFFARLPLLTLLQLVFGILFFEVIQ